MATFLSVVSTVLEIKPKALHTLHTCFASEPCPPPSPVIPSFENRYLGQKYESADKLHVYMDMSKMNSLNREIIPLKKLVSFQK